MHRNVLLSLAIAIFTASAVSAKEDFIVDTSSIGKSHNGVVSSDQFLELGMRTPNALRLEGENSLRMGNLDRAIMVLQRSVEMAPMDMDGRILYAQALEQKLIGQKERDPALFNFVVKQWLFVAKKAEFPDQSIQGRSHLINLTGVAPKLFESTQKYLSRVLLPEDGSTKVALGKKKAQGKEQNKESF
ncbi:MAG: hypothetical protein HY711_08325 [Candidatus Melainabacteria bacterium]|nr:hypothetical protein [Candidatus Melainabacteria bacterium]